MTEYNFIVSINLVGVLLILAALLMMIAAMEFGLKMSRTKIVLLVAIFGITGVLMGRWSLDKLESIHCASLKGSYINYKCYDESGKPIRLPV